MTATPTPPPSPETETWRPAHPELPPGVPAPAASAAEGERAWRPWTAWAGMATVFGGSLVVSVVVAAVVALAGGEAEDLPPGALLATMLALDALFVGVAILFARTSGPVGARQFGLRGTRFWQAVGWAALLYLAYFTFAAVWGLIVGEPDEQSVVEDLGIRRDDLALIGGAVVICVVAPLAEELFFRGFFYAALRNWRGALPAALITGLVFGSLHFEGISKAEFILPLMFLGFVLCLVREKTGSLYPCIAIHAINNAIAYGVIVGWDWQIPLLVVGATAVCLGLARAAGRRWAEPRSLRASA